MGRGEGSSKFVAADAQFTNARVLKPFDDFEAIYQGKTGFTPISMPGVRDPNAGTPGYSPNLVAGLSVPLGARILTWIPQPCNVFTTYRYYFVFRMRSLRDFRNPAKGKPRGAYHIPLQRSGQPDTSSGTAEPRVQIPAAVKVIAFEQPEPTEFCSSGVIRIRREDLESQMNPGGLPFLADGSVGVFQQGILDPASPVVGGIASQPIFLPFWFDAEGDDMIVVVEKSDNAAWDFGGPDQVFSDIYGTGNGTHPPLPGSGILVFTGTNP